MKNKRTLLALLILSAAFLSTFSACAADSSGIGKFDIEKVRSAVIGKTADGQTGAVKLPQTPNVVSVITRTIFWLAVILLLIAGVVFVFRRIVYSRGGAGRGAGALDIIESMTLVPGKTIMLVRAADKVIVLGVYQDGMECFATFEGEKALEIIQSGSREGMPRTMTQFSESLNQFMDKFKTKA